MASPDQRDQDVLTTNAADLLPVETPWQGTPRSPLFLLETPYRQLIPFSLFDPSMSDANLFLDFELPALGEAGCHKHILPRAYPLRL